MGIPLRVLDEPPGWNERKPGDMWRYPPGDRDGRECWWVELPQHPDCGTPGHPSHICWRTTDEAADPPHGMWDVTGEPPHITVNPSIDCMRFVTRDGTTVREGSYWHGFIRNGEIVDA